MSLPAKITFLSLAQVKMIHRDLIERYGGTHGIRDEGLIRSAIAQPIASFDGKLLHPTIFLMAASYLFSLARKHGFVDGNKRVAAAVARAFLYINGISLKPDEDEFFNIVCDAAVGKVTKDEIAGFFEQSSSELRG